jgi:transposase
MQGRVTMESIIVGIDVSKQQLDIALRPGGEAFAVTRDAAGLEQLIARLSELNPHIVPWRRPADTRASLPRRWRRLACPWPWSIPPRSAPLLKH